MHIADLSTAVSTALAHSPSVTAFIVVFLVIARALFFRWFVRQPKSIREDVIRLVQANRGK
jgi:hypothetical protein